MIIDSKDNNAIPPQTPPRTKSLGQSDFLRLMIAQAQNQDPMSPQTNGEFMSQLAQFSANDGINKMQQSMEQLASSFQSGEALRASALVGKNVLINSNQMHLPKEGNATGAVEVPTGIGDLKVSIYSANGELIKTMDIAHEKEGLTRFSWDGTDKQGKRVEAGEYTMRVSGDMAGKEMELPAMTTGKVEDVRISQYGQGVIINVSGLGAMPLHQVLQIMAD